MSDFVQLLLALAALWILVVAAAIGIRFLAQRSLASSAEPTTQATGSGWVASSEVVASSAPRGVAVARRPGEPETAGPNPAVAHSATTATEDRGGEVRRVPASGAQPSTGSTPRDDPAVLGRDR